MADNAVNSPENPENVLIDPISESIPEFVDWLPESLVLYWQTLDSYPVFAALVIACLFYIAAFIIRAIVIRSIDKLAARTATDVDDRVIDGLKRPVFSVVFFSGLILAVKSAKLPFGSDFVINVVVSIVVVTLMRAAFFVSTELLRALARNHQRFSAIEERTIPLLDLISKLLILLFGSYALLMVWGVNPVGWLASAGIVGLAVGFAAQDTLANLFAGFFILIDAPYKLNDYVNLDSGERGRVTHIGMRSTRLLTRDDVEVTVPNNVMGNAKIINESGGPHEKMRIRIAVGAAYGSDVHSVEALLIAVAKKYPRVCVNPAPRVRMRGFGDSSLDFELLVWIQQPELKGLVSHELFKLIYDAMNAANIEIPYPKRDLYVKEMPSAAN